MSDVIRMMTPGQAAAHYGVSTRTLARWRTAGTGPAWVQHGRSIRYPVEVTPAVLTVLTTHGPIGEPGRVVPDGTDLRWRTVEAVQVLEPADPQGSPAWLTTLRPATADEAARWERALSRLWDAMWAEDPALDATHNAPQDGAA